ncbi:Gfo/Idh/MocA family protein [Dermatobacter hominis]|uniref:Gfo/Idh/MocA family protein n=1 Tax=Dermatobacter hominis TaxID=2884263 RepID=UPI001D1229EB|nr:Gfo/Idh/MocA family oxidoreductase [Dermatobacter hominis]UDY35190.1 Gfo/Idh/MocA family oxidoreductase [Dermatobacter hominis]
MTRAATAPIRYGFVGVGMMGQEHIRDVAALPGAEVVAVADPHEPSVAGARAAAGADVPAHPDVESMLAAEELDAVVISTPNHTHRQVLEPLWSTSLHLMVEKPLCTTVEDCVAVREAASRHDGVVWVGLEYRYMPPVQRFLAAVVGEGVGAVRSLSIREHRFPFLVKVDDWNRFSANTGGTLVEKCCHFFDLMRVVVPGEPVRVMASGAQDVNHLDERYEAGVPDILDNAFVIVDFDSGARALLDLSMFAEGSAFEQELVAVGDAGRVQVELPGFMEQVRGRRAVLTIGSRGEGWPVERTELDADDRVLHEGAHHGASFLEHVEFCAAIRDGRAAAVGVDDGLWSVAMGVAAHRSIDEGRPVRLDELGLPPDPR